MKGRMIWDRQSSASTVPMDPAESLTSVPTPRLSSAITEPPAARNVGT